jgi:hypothetical protein
MKYLKTYESYDIISNSKNLHDEEIYYFKSPKNTYKVRICPFQGKSKYYCVGFGVASEYTDFDVYKITNENPYETLNTVFEIVVDFKTKLETEYKKWREKSLDNMYALGYYNPDVPKESAIDGFIFSLSGDKEKSKQRYNLYKRMIDKYLPNSTITYDAGIYYIKLPK